MGASPALSFLGGTTGKGADTYFEQMIQTSLLKKVGVIEQKAKTSVDRRGVAMGVAGVTSSLGT